MAWFHRVVSFILLITIPIFSIRPAISAEAIPSTAENTVPLFDLTNGTPVITYDQFLDLIDALEEGELDDLPPEEIEHLLRFVAFITEKGAHFLSDAALGEVKRDTQALLSGSTHDASDLVELEAWHRSEGYSVIPAVYAGSREIILCKSWASKRIHHIKKYVKKHKKAFIIGGAVVAAAVTVVCVAAIVTSAGTAALGEAGAAAAGLAATAADKDNHHGEDEEDPSTGSQHEESNTPSSPPTEQAASLSKAVKNQLEAIEEANAIEPIFNRAETSGSMVDSVRETAAYITHDALNGAASVGALVPSLQEEGQGVYGSVVNRSADSNSRQGGPRENYHHLIENAHKVIDRLFGTNQTAAFSSEAATSNDKFDVGIIPLPGTAANSRILPTQTNNVRGWNEVDPENWTG